MTAKQTPQFGISSAPQAPHKSPVQLAIEAAQFQLVYGKPRFTIHTGGMDLSGDEPRLPVYPDQFRHHEDATPLHNPEPFTNPAREARYNTVGSHRYAFRTLQADGTTLTEGSGVIDDTDRISALEQVNRWNLLAATVEADAHTAIPDSPRLVSVFWLLDPQ